MDKYCYTVTFGVDQFTGEVLTQAEDILSQKFFLSMVYGGDFKPPLIRARDGQLLADGMLYHLSKIRPFDAVAGLGITPLDIYSDGLNFVFGIASPLVRNSIVSYNRLLTSDKELFISRVRKEITHEMGHVFGLEHCSYPGCVMNFSNSVYEVDLKSENFCPSCRRKLLESLKNLGVIEFY